jgi:AraC family transcriptional regulator
MNGKCPSAVLASSDNNIGDLSAVAARLLDAACFARDGDGAAAKTHIARAMAILSGEPSAIPAGVQPPERRSRTIVRGGFAAWQKRRLTAYIDANLSGRLRIEELAGLLNLSESHFSRAFRRSFDTSAHEYLTRRRIEMAQSLMLTGREPLSAIALHCGLSDQAHFTRVFRRIVGETPSVWRRTRAGEIEDLATERRRSTVSRPVAQATSNARPYVADFRVANRIESLDI